MKASKSNSARNAPPLWVGSLLLLATPWVIIFVQTLDLSYAFYGALAAAFMGGFVIYLIEAINLALCALALRTFSRAYPQISKLRTFSILFFVVETIALLWISMFMGFTLYNYLQ